MSKCQTSCLFLRHFDLFGVRPSLFFQGKYKAGTNFGIILSFFVIVFTIICFAYFGQEMFYQLNPKIQYHQEYEDFPESMTINPENFPVMIELNSFYGETFYTNKSLLNIKVSQFSILKTENKTIVSNEEYDMEICNKSHFSKLDRETSKYFLEKKLGDYFCIPKYLKNLTMEGAFDQRIFKAIRFTVSKCTNSSKNTCVPKEEIEKKMSKGFIGIYFMDYAINPGDYKNPKKKQPKEVFTSFVLGEQKQIDINFQNNYISTDDGIILENSSIQRISNAYNYEHFDFREENDDFFLIFLKMKQLRGNYHRKYKKFQDLLAEIGGFINCFWIVALVFNTLYNRLFIITKILTKVFTIKLTVSPTKSRFSNSFSERKGYFRNTKEIYSATYGHRKNSLETKKHNKEESEMIHSRIEAKSEELKENSSNLTNKQKITFIPLIPPKHLEDDSFGKDISMDHSFYSRRSTRRIKEVQSLKKVEDDLKIFEEIDSFKLNFLDYLYYYTGCFKTREREKKKMIIVKGFDICSNLLDIKNIIKKFYEIEKLKQILLSEKEIKEFNKLPKPEIIFTQNVIGKKSVTANLFNRSITLKKDETPKNANLMKRNFK